MTLVEVVVLTWLGDCKQYSDAITFFFFFFM